MNRVAVFLALPYIVGLALFFVPSLWIEEIYGEKNFAYLNWEYLAIVLGALICTILPFYLVRLKPVISSQDEKSLILSHGSGPIKTYTIFFVLILLLVASSVTDLESYRDAATKYAFLVDIFELIVISSLAKRTHLRKGELLGITFVAVLNIITLRRYALIPFLLIVLYLIRGKIKFTRIAKNTALVAVSFLVIQFVREASSDGLPVLTLSSAYVILPWNRLAMLVDGIVAQPYAGELFYSFTSLFLPPGLPAGSLMWSDALGMPTKDILSQDLEFKTLQLIKAGYLPINWYTMIGDLYSDMRFWLLLYVGIIASIGAFSMRIDQRFRFMKVISAYLFTALMLTGTYNILMFPRFVWMLIVASCLVAIPKVKLF